VQELIQHHDLIVLDHHGAVAVGESLTAARQKMEKLEHTAKILLAADQLGTIRPLSATAILALQQLKK